MATRKDKSKSKWLDSEWEDWINEALEMYRLAMQFPAQLRMEMWREEYDKRKAEFEALVAARAVA